MPSMRPCSSIAIALNTRAATRANSLRFIEPYRAAIRSSSPESVSDSGERQR